MTGWDAELLEQAEALADLLAGRTMNAGKPIAGVHPNITAACETLRELAGRLRLALAVVEAARPFIPHDAPGARKPLREACAAFEDGAP